jgi:arabinogalactan endo-1,4-beta-galactosidase
MTKKDTNRYLVAQDHLTHIADNTLRRANRDYELCTKKLFAVEKAIKECNPTIKDELELIHREISDEKESIAEFIQNHRTSIDVLELLFEKQLHKTGKETKQRVEKLQYIG